ncbi:MAG TPA: flagellar type III secretion system protein FlhB [Erwinia persicina]|uniref:Flagellar biosynthetic protein FlhB n=1 Tax=Erwinia persicina TaxID=55211 RepID=A0A3S7TG81_9GAMM|nr:flagellar biosynthesis protein FlhB [Erwinia persicina]AXU97813.1 flagellar type III secretion system protein FlhB [Erwinia persicina]MBC3943732.1 flagellar type III secretion system protein FlhB [Erwinia persicina]MBD8104811.1 flagellar type III secretion system protein FlhB [Erwinia persicina]MBD8167043.1 flagellar type III secretion system protein FlhB [Erwinia persicina]MBD8207957.1 flagellar type III secretion system protein FlhB [Erwinia persicina]
MSQDSDQEKTESPTAHRLEKAREEGQIPRSRELTSILMLVTGLSILWVGGEWMGRKLGALVADGLVFNHSVVSDTSQMLHQIANLLMQAVLAILPMMFGLVVMAIAAPMLLGGLVISGKSIKFDFGKMNPIKGLAKLVSAQSAAELLKAVLKATLVGVVTWLYIWHHWAEMLRLISESPVTALASALNMIAMCSILVVLGLSPMVGFDVFFQVYSYFKNLRMSRQDIMDEHKQQEGDPHVKGRIRQQMRAAARRRMMQDVPKADVIVTNPTHYSVALQYDEKKMSAPKVLAKGAGEIALRIRELGKEHRIPILEAPPLARALYRHSEIGQHIPGTLYAAVAEVLAWVWQLRRWKVEGGLIPKRPVKLPVPDGLDFVGEQKSDG